MLTKGRTTHAGTPSTQARHGRYRTGTTCLAAPDKPQVVATTYVIIEWVLQGGVILSAVVIAIGLLLMSLQPNTFAPEQLQPFPHTFAQVGTELLALQPQAVIALGLLLLIATPVLRVAVALVAFAVERDWRFVVITLLVLLILLFSIFFVGQAVGVAQHQRLQHGAYSWVYPVLIFVGAMAAGFSGSLVGLGGGVLIVPHTHQLKR